MLFQHVVWSAWQYFRVASSLWFHFFCMTSKTQRRGAQEVTLVAQRQRVTESFLSASELPRSGWGSESETTSPYVRLLILYLGSGLLFLGSSFTLCAPSTNRAMHVAVLGLDFRGLSLGCRFERGGGVYFTSLLYLMANETFKQQQLGFLTKLSVCAYQHGNKC